MVESVKERGVLSPVLVRPMPDGSYQMAAPRHFELLYLIGLFLLQDGLNYCGIQFALFRNSVAPFFREEKSSNFGGAIWRKP